MYLRLSISIPPFSCFALLDTVHARPVRNGRDSVMADKTLQAVVKDNRACSYRTSRVGKRRCLKQAFAKTYVVPSPACDRNVRAPSTLSSIADFRKARRPLPFSPKKIKKSIMSSKSLHSTLPRNVKRTQIDHAFTCKKRKKIQPSQKFSRKCRHNKMQMQMQRARNHIYSQSQSQRKQTQRVSQMPPNFPSHQTHVPSLECARMPACLSFLLNPSIF